MKICLSFIKIKKQKKTNKQNGFSFWKQNCAHCQVFLIDCFFVSKVKVFLTMAENLRKLIYLHAHSVIFIHNEWRRKPPHWCFVAAICCLKSFLTWLSVVINRMGQPMEDISKSKNETNDTQNQPMEIMCFFECSTSSDIWFGRRIMCASLFLWSWRFFSFVFCIRNRRSFNECALLAILNLTLNMWTN